MLVVGIGLTGLGSIEHYLTLGLFIRANQSTATAGGYHLVAIERKHTIFAKSSENLPVKLASKAFGGILYERNIIFICHRHDLVYLVGHPIQSHRNNRFGLSAGLVDTVPDSLLQKNRIHVPCISLRIHEYRSSTEVGHRMGRGTKGKALYYHFITLTNSASKQGQVYRCCTCTQGHYLFILSHEAFQILLEGIHIRTERYYPVGIEGFLYEAHLLAAHVSKAKIYSLIHKIINKFFSKKYNEYYEDISLFT